MFKFWYFNNLAQILIFSFEKPQPQPIAASLPSTPARVRHSLTNMQSNNTSPQSNIPQLPENVQHDEEGPFIVVDGFSKFQLANAAAASAVAPSSRKPDSVVEPPILATLSPIKTLPVAVPDPIPEPPAEAPAEALESVIKAKLKKKKAIKSPLIPSFQSRLLARSATASSNRLSNLTRYLEWKSTMSKPLVTREVESNGTRPR